MLSPWRCQKPLRGNAGSTLFLVFPRRALYPVPQIDQHKPMNMS
jgi:hypothetical protein